MYSRIQATIAALAITFLLSGCGDLLGTKVSKKQIDGSQFAVQCELDLDRFSEILHENISSQINCLKENLHLFIRVVKSGKPGYLSRVQLEQYIQRYRPDVKPEVLRALKSVFDLGHLITGEDPDFISKDTVDKVMNFALIFNEQAALHFGPVFENETPTSYTVHMNARERISEANRLIIKSLIPIFNRDRNGQLHKLNIIDLLESFTTETTRPGIEKAKKLLFGKKILFGGDEQVLTHLELEQVILKFDQLLLIGLDVIRYKYLILSQESLLQLIQKDVDELYPIVTDNRTVGDRDELAIFTLNQAIEAAKLFIDKNDLDIDKFKKLIIEAKKIVMGGNGTDIKGAELKQLFGHAKNILETGTIFHRIYAKFSKELESPLPVNIDFREYEHTYPENRNELLLFERIVKNYRFMKGAKKLNDQDDNSWFTFPSSFYTRNYRRNANGVVEIAIFEYVLKLLFYKYGERPEIPSPVFERSIDQAKMQEIFKIFETELVELDLILPQNYRNTADNISLLGTLFQNQSDQNKVMDVNEATEFGISLWSSLNIADDVYSYLVTKDCHIDPRSNKELPFKRLDPSCVRGNFWKGLCHSYRDYYPQMFEYLGLPQGASCESLQNSEHNRQFLDRAIIASRTCNNYPDGDKEEIPYAKGDFMTIMLALIHSETTILRWDSNRNNLMDADEVDRAYSIYEPALDGFLKDKSPIIKRFKKQIYQYMIKYEQVPNEKDFASIWKFVKFLLNFNKKSPGNRKTIVSLLVAIAEQNKLGNPGPGFNCAFMRDPDNIPRGVNTRVAEGPNGQMTANELNLALQFTSELLNRFSSRDKQMLKDELYLFTDDIRTGLVSDVASVRQPTIRRIFSQIQADKVQMAGIRASIPEGNDLHKIGLAVSTLLTE